MTNRTVLVFLDVATEVRTNLLEMLTMARALGRVEVVAVEAPTVEVLAQLGAYGVETVHQAELAREGASISGDERYLPTVVAAGLVAAARLTDADMVLLPTSFAVKETAALVARDLGAGLVVDAAAVREQDGRIVADKRVFAASWNTECAVTTTFAVITVRAHSVVAKPAQVAVEPVTEGFTVEVPHSQVTLLSRVVKADSSGRPPLDQAAVVVAGGRGTDGDFGPIEDLADALNGAVSASRDAAFEGWWDSYVGQTGVTVTPRVYIGAGISGAPHHRGGMRASQVIVAVNSDPEAPIFEICDFAVVGQLENVLPQAAVRIREYRGESG